MWRLEQNTGGDDFATWVVADAADDRFQGTSRSSTSTPTRAPPSGLPRAPTERGRGVATAALTTAAARVFVEKGLRRLELFHAVDNPASCVVV